MYSGQFANVAILPVANPLVISNLYGYIHEVDSHKKSKHSDLALNEFWVTQCDWLQVCTIFYMGITIITSGKYCILGLREITMKK